MGICHQANAYHVRIDVSAAGAVLQGDVAHSNRLLRKEGLLASLNAVSPTESPALGRVPVQSSVSSQTVQEVALGNAPVFKLQAVPTNMPALGSAAKSKSDAAVSSTQNQTLSKTQPTEKLDDSTPSSAANSDGGVSTTAIESDAEASRPGDETVEEAKTTEEPANAANDEDLDSFSTTSEAEGEEPAEAEAESTTGSETGDADESIDASTTLEEDEEEPRPSEESEEAPAESDSDTPLKKSTTTREQERKRRGETTTGTQSRSTSTATPKGRTTSPTTQQAGSQAGKRTQTSTTLSTTRITSQSTSVSGTGTGVSTTTAPGGTSKAASGFEPDTPTSPAGQTTSPGPQPGTSQAGQTTSAGPQSATSEGKAGESARL